MGFQVECHCALLEGEPLDVAADRRRPEDAAQMLVQAQVGTAFQTAARPPGGMSALVPVKSRQKVISDQGQALGTPAVVEGQVPDK